jgi:GDPmannose 4,6-dehydratase
MKIALITGISGQDGAYLSQLLLQKGYKVIGLTRNNHSVDLHGLHYLNIEENIIIEECDLQDMTTVINLVKKYLPDEIYNLAAQSSVGLSFTQPIGTISFNIISVLNLLEAVRIIKPDVKFYQASSSEMYGEVKELPVKINTPMHPLSPYAISKSSAYWIVVNYRESYGIFACNGVLFNHESYLRSKNFFIKKVISEAVKNKNKPDWILNVGNIDVRRDFGYSPEYVKAMWLMLQQDKAEDFMICSGISITLRSIIEYVFKKLGIDNSKIIIDNSLFRPTDIVDIYGDNTDAKEKLQWESSNNFYEILNRLIDEEEENILAQL